MIFSRLDEERSFAACPHAIRKVLEYLRDTDVMALPLGRQAIDGERIILNVMDMTTRPFEGSHPEVHQQYIDLMYWPEGGERIGVAPYLGTEKVFEARPEGGIAPLVALADEGFLLPTAGRPLSQSGDLAEMYRLRKPLYHAAADVVIDNSVPLEETAALIWDDFQNQ